MCEFVVVRSFVCVFSTNPICFFAYIDVHVCVDIRCVCLCLHASVSLRETVRHLSGRVYLITAGCLHIWVQAGLRLKHSFEAKILKSDGKHHI